MNATVRRHSGSLVPNDHSPGDYIHIDAVPGFCLENSSFGGIKDPGLGIKEGVIEAIKAYSFVKTFSLPW